MPRKARLPRFLQSNGILVLLFAAGYIFLLILIQASLNDESGESTRLRTPRSLSRSNVSRTNASLPSPESRVDRKAEDRLPSVHAQLRDHDLNNFGLDDLRDLARVPVVHPQISFNFSNHLVVKELQGVQLPPYKRCVNSPVREKHEFVEIIRHLYVFSVFWDKRWNDFDNKFAKPQLRAVVLASWKHTTARTHMYCVFLDETGRNYSSPMRYYEMCENHGLPAGGVIMSCQVPEALGSDSPPCTARISPTPVFNDPMARDFAVVSLMPRPVRRNFSVCVSPLHGNVQSSELMEWMEMTSLLGSQFATFYNLDMSPAAEALLKLYESYDRAKLVRWNLTEEMDNAIWYHGQMIALTDCLFRTIPESKYVAFHDLDEIIFPHNFSDYVTMAEKLFKNDTCGLAFTMSYFVPGEVKVEPHFRHLKFVAANSRTRSLDLVRNKVLAKSELIFEVGIHHISKPVDARLQTVVVGPYSQPVALLHHYRRCRFSFMCSSWRDEHVVRERYATKLDNRVKQVEEIFKNVTGVHINRPALVNLS